MSSACKPDVEDSPVYDSLYRRFDGSPEVAELIEVIDQAGRSVFLLIMRVVPDGCPGNGNRHPKFGKFAVSVGFWEFFCPNPHPKRVLYSERGGA